MSDDALTRKAPAILSEPPTEGSVIAFVRRLDVVSADEATYDWARVLLARSVAAVGPLVVETEGHSDEHPVRRTIRAAERFALDPTEANDLELAVAATSSYPFGPGDGCLAVVELDTTKCEVGTGCRSGSGALYRAGYCAGFEPVAKRLASELVPWLNGDDDPIARRAESR